GARAGMRAEYGDAVGALDELHRRAPARIDFDRIRECVASGESDTVDTDEAEFVRCRFGKRGGCGHERVIVLEDGFTSRRENIAAIAEAVHPERAVADQLSKDAERHGAAGGRGEHDRAWCPVDEPLKI